MLRSDDMGAAWGWNQQGQRSVQEPFSGVVGIAAGFHHTVALVFAEAVSAGADARASLRFAGIRADFANLAVGTHTAEELRVAIPGDTREGTYALVLAAPDAATAGGKALKARCAPGAAAATVAIPGGRGQVDVALSRG